MATIKFSVNGTKRKLVPIYIRFSAGRGNLIIVPTEERINPKTWSNATQTVKQRIRSEDDEKLIKNLSALKDSITSEIRNNRNGFTKEWLQAVVDKFYNKKGTDAKTLNDYIVQYIQDIKTGDKKSKLKRDYAPGSVRVFEGLRNALNEYQGIYSSKQLKAFERENKKRKAEGQPLKELRPLRRLDFEGVNIDFYDSFVKFLSDEGYALNTQGRHIKILKIIMKKSLQAKLHNNQEFKEDAFSGIHEDSFAIALTPDEIEKVYTVDLSKLDDKWLELSRDAWCFLYETCLRISDYKQIPEKIIEMEGKRFIHIYQEKTDREIYIPLTARFNDLWEKYNHTVPEIKEQMINRKIKDVACMAGIDRQVSWKTKKYGKKFERTAKAWELISCHTARRSGATNLWNEKFPISDIMLLLGHATEKQTMEYIKVDKKQAALRMSEHPHFSNHLTVVKAG
jgi:site-specific recombinase XerD